MKTTVNLETIDKIRDQLKHEFVGIDYVIDHVINSIITWLNSDKMRTPNVICLWGMTGCGKTHLVRRLISLLDIERDSLYFHMGNMDGISGLFDKIEDQPNMNSKSIFIFDEFQMCNTIDPRRDEDIERPALKDLWGLLDSGKIIKMVDPISSYTRRSLVDEFYYVVKHKLENLSVAKIKKHKKHSEEIYDIIDVNYYLKITKFLDEHIDDQFSMREDFETYTMNELWEIYQKALDASVQKEYDFSKSLIFVLGNLDILYKASSDVESDLDPDILYNLYKKIKFQDGKNALLKLFRPEQISRFGNNHVFYNAFSKEQYYHLIEMYLNKVNEYYDINLDYDPSIHEMIYKEGVFPTQGVRPLISTIKYTIETNIFHILKFVKTKKKIKLSYDHGNLIVDNKHKIKLILVNTVLGVDRNATFLRTCVHEAGHAWMCYKMFGEAPNNIVIKINSKDPSGFIESTNKSNFWDKDMCERKICMLLGGLCAEIMVYGSHDNGSESDLEKATAILSLMVHNYGFEDTLLSTKLKYDDGSINVKNSSKFASALIKTLKDQTLDILRQDKKQYKKLVKALSAKTKMNASDFYELFPKLKKTDDTSDFYNFFGK